MFHITIPTWVAVNNVAFAIPLLLMKGWLCETYIYSHLHCGSCLCTLSASNTIISWCEFCMYTHLHICTMDVHNVFILSQDLPWVPQLAATLMQVFPSWRKELEDFPVLTWKQFLYRTQEQISQSTGVRWETMSCCICTQWHRRCELVFFPYFYVKSHEIEITVKDNVHVCTYLVYVFTLHFLLSSYFFTSSDCVHIKESFLSNIVVLDPNWLRQQVFWLVLSPQNSVIAHIKLVTGCILLKDLAIVYPEIELISLMHLFEYFELCRQLKDTEMYEFPCLIKMDPLFGLWEREPHLSVYAGVQLSCSLPVHMFSPSLFPRMQLHIRAAFSDDLDDQEVILWSDGLKCCRGEVEVCMRQTVPNKALVFRGTEDTREECVALFHQFYSILLTTIRESSPGTMFSTSVLSSTDLRAHHHHPHHYSSMEVFSAENGILSPKSGDVAAEDIAELLCCGHRGMVTSALSAPFTSVRCISLQTRVELCHMFDPPDPLGRDWCLLILQLGLQE